ncbi:MAG: trigger factor [Sulfurovum sp.]|nr:trigger factor [Sulfurovum sp.]
MKITVEKLDDINFSIAGNIDNSVIDNKIKELKEVADKAPEVEGETLDAAAQKQKIEEEAAGLVFKDFVAAGIKEANIDVDTLLGQPALRKYEQQGDSVHFEVEVSISPEIDTNIEYMDIVPEFTQLDADPAAVEAKLTAFAEQQAPFKALETAKPVENGDVAVIDFAGFIDNQAFEGGSSEKFNLKIGSNSFIPGFEEQIIGMEYGDEREVKVTFPTDYSSEDLAGKEATFVVKLHEIQEQKAEEPDDAFAKKILSDDKATLTTLKEKFAEQLTSEELSEIYVRDLKPKLVAGLLTKFDFTLPMNVVEQEIDAKVSEMSRRFSEEDHKMYRDDKDKFIALRDSIREEAQNTIKIALIIEALAKKEGIDVHEQEVHAALGYQAMMRGQDAQELVKYYEENNLMHSAKMGLTEDKLFGKLLGFDKR